MVHVCVHSHACIQTLNCVYSPLKRVFPLELDKRWPKPKTSKQSTRSLRARRLCFQLCPNYAEKWVQLRLKPTDRRPHNHNPSFFEPHSWTVTMVAFGQIATKTHSQIFKHISQIVSYLRPLFSNKNITIVALEFSVWRMIKSWYKSSSHINCWNNLWTIQSVKRWLAKTGIYSRFLPSICLQVPKSIITSLQFSDERQRRLTAVGTINRPEISRSSSANGFGLSSVFWVAGQTLLSQLWTSNNRPLARTRAVVPTSRFTAASSLNRTTMADTAAWWTNGARFWRLGSSARCRGPTALRRTLMNSVSVIYYFPVSDSPSVVEPFRTSALLPFISRSDKFSLLIRLLPELSINNQCGAFADRVSGNAYPADRQWEFKNRALHMQLLLPDSASTAFSFVELSHSDPRLLRIFSPWRYAANVACWDQPSVLETAASSCTCSTEAAALD